MKHLAKLCIARESTGRNYGRIYTYDKYLKILNEGAEPLLSQDGNSKGRSKAMETKPNPDGASAKLRRLASSALAATCVIAAHPHEGLEINA